MSEHLARFAAAYAAGAIRAIDLTQVLSGAVIVAAPLKIQAGSGSPLRVLALVDRPAG